MKSEVSVDVLVVGAGPVGLALALELGLHGHRVLVVEQSDRGGTQPRAKTTNIRSMTHMRRWGVAEVIHRKSPLPADYPRDIVFATRLFGYPLARFQNPFFGAAVQNPLFPENAEWIPQYTVEAVLRERLAQLGNVTLRFSAELKRFTQDADTVSATIKDTASAKQFNVSCAYAVGADGGRSTTRRLLNIEYEGDHAYMANFLAIYRAPGLINTHPQAKAVSYWLVNSESPAVTGPMDRDDVWFYSTQLKAGVPPYSGEVARVKIAQTIGRDVPFEILETDVWQAHKLIAQTYRQGRIFLAGDACHLHPPMGGYGMNGGIGDAVDLGWKLSAVLSGWGDAELLATYEKERKPVHRMFINEATRNYAFVTHHMVMDILELDTPEGEHARAQLGQRILDQKKREFTAIGAVLGYSYDPSSIVIADGTAAPAHDPLTYVPTARPGSLAPHLWLADGSSLYDHFGLAFCLLVIGPDPDGFAEQFAAAARELAMPLSVFHLSQALARPLYAAKLVLVRPDQHVAWRGEYPSRDPRELLSRVSGHYSQVSDVSVARAQELST
jgi:2-polyprenyl-6-methoxyphenol hydroxylase-like FAD-dependent oxidoreductase